MKGRPVNLGEARRRLEAQARDPERRSGAATLLALLEAGGAVVDIDGELRPFAATK